MYNYSASVACFTPSPWTASCKCAVNDGWVRVEFFSLSCSSWPVTTVASSFAKPINFA